MPRKAVPFPKNFLWGASTAAHQVEGNTHNQWTIWEHEHARVRSVKAEYEYGKLAAWPHIKDRATDPNNYISGTAADHYRRYKSDFDILERLNLNAFRFSVEWSRIEPEEGVWDAGEIAHYKDYIDELKRRNIEPMMTLFHFTLPVWFEKMGGFEKRKNVKYFLRFVEKVMEELGRDVRYVITINEPQVFLAQGYWLQEWPPMKHSAVSFLMVAANLVRAHNKAAKIIHAHSRKHKVSIANASINVYPGDDSWLSKLSARVIQYATEEYFLRRVIRKCDFIGVNFYFSSRVYGYRIHNNDRRKNDLGWSMHPDHLTHVLDRLYTKFKKPVIVTESGVADHDDSRRKWWIASSIAAIERALEAGIDVRGYMHWSLLDNFEWSHGHWPDFGLVSVDLETKKRTVRPSALWWANIVKKYRQESEI